MASFYLICQRGSTFAGNSQTAVLGNTTQRKDSATQMAPAFNTVLPRQRQGFLATESRVEANHPSHL